jgi:hypothetical protein
MWTLSGLSHPFMSNWFRPTIANEVYKTDQKGIKPALSVQQVLDKNEHKRIGEFWTDNF